MKNHIRTPDGRLLQTNKSWSSLKQSQKEKIIDWFKLELSNYYEQNGEYPMDHKSEEVLHAVYNRIEEAGIWIPHGEVYREFNSRKMKMMCQRFHFILFHELMYSLLQVVVISLLMVKQLL